MAIDQDITNLPTPPSRSDSPSDFSDKADTFLAALPQLQTELNTYADEANATQQIINTSETNAATSESNAASSEAAASTSASNAATSESNAAASESNVESLYNQFDDRYLGSKSSDPATDNDGNALLTGAIYYNTNVPELRIYDGSAWQQAVFNVDASGALLATNNLSDLTSSDTAIQNLGITATTTELNLLDGVTATTAELNYNDITTLGVSEANKVITTDASNDTSIGGSVTATTYFGDGSNLTGIEAGGGLQSVQVFTSSGTWTKPSGITKVKVTVIGGGGGGSFYGSDGNNGGGGGGSAIGIIDVSSTSSVSVTVGAGGSGGSSGSQDGGDGGSSSFGTFCTGNGGSGAAGQSLSSFGVGGTATGGDVNVRGQDGSNPPPAPGGGGGEAMGATGGDSILGFGGPLTGYVNDGRDGKGFGGGGSGANDITASGAGNGAGGIVIVEEFK